MPVYTVHEAKTHLSKLIERGERSEAIQTKVCKAALDRHGGQRPPRDDAGSV